MRDRLLATRELQINPKNADVLAELARYHAMLGEAEAAERLREAIAIGPPSPEREFTFAVTYARLGRTEETLDCLERAVGAGFPRAWVHDNPVFQELRGQPRFQDLMRRVP